MPSRSGPDSFHNGRSQGTERPPSVGPGRQVLSGQEAGPTGVRVKAEAPLSDMFGYIGDLRTMTSGRGQFSMEFSHYSAVPKNVADEVIKEVKEREAAK